MTRDTRVLKLVYRNYRPTVDERPSFKAWVRGKASDTYRGEPNLGQLAAGWLRRKGLER